MEDQSKANKDPVNPLDKALEDLQKAETHLADAHTAEAKAEHEVEAAIEEVKEAEKHRDEVEVHVTHVNEVERATFEEKLTATLQEVWNTSYLKLKIEKKPKDIFQTAGQHPKSLMSYLSLSLERARHECIIADFCFGIASETGGA